MDPVGEMMERLTHEQLVLINEAVREFDGQRPPGLPRALMEAIDLLLYEVRHLREENERLTAAMLVQQIARTES